MNIIDKQQQMLIVITPSWDSVQGVLWRYERSGANHQWQRVDDEMAVVVGKAGLAWGIGLHPVLINDDLQKVEGDGKAPAGIFSIGPAFGFHSAETMNHLRIEYIALDDQVEAVDDPQSKYYNQIVRRKEITDADWHSSEQMNSIPLYNLGLVINHNYPNPKQGAGSAIFLHIWRNKFSGTAGCTAADQHELAIILSWLDQDKHPILVQLPQDSYNSLQQKWNLPRLSHLPQAKSFTREDK